MNYEDALNLATEKHKGQKRKVSGKDYIIHPIAVADRFREEEYKKVAILHDTIEDTDLTLDDLRRYGLEEDLIFAIHILTRKQDQTYLDYLIQIKKYEITRAIKVEDLKHNISDNPPTKCQKDKYLMALYILGENQ